MAELFIHGKDEMPVCAPEQFKGHSGSPVIGVFCAAGGTEFGVAAERYEFESAALGAAVHGAAIRGVAAVDDLFDVFHDDRPWIYIVCNGFIMICKHSLYHIHEIIMRQSKVKSKLFPS